MKIKLNAGGAMLSSSRDEQRYIPLGVRRNDRVSRRDRRRLRGEEEGVPDGIWGTLGGWDTEMPPLRGTIMCSDYGSVQSSAELAGEATMEEIRMVRMGRAEHFNQDPEAAVIERYISFTPKPLPELRDGFTLDELPKMRLTLFVKPDEGALVFYQRTATGAWKNKIDDPFDTEIEYLLPEPTANGDCENRDRLNYQIPVYPSADFEAVETDNGIVLKSTSRSASKLVIKALVFKRQNSTSQDVLKRVAERLALNRHNLQIWNTAPGSYYFTDVTANDIDFNKRTLLLLHGTFSSTRGTYGGLFERKKNDASTQAVFLQQLIDNGHFEQILAFDHDTVFLSPDKNAERLEAMLGDNEFAHPITAMGFSRGALLLKCLACRGNKFKIARAVTVAGANHVEYTRLPGRLSALCNALKRITPPSAMLTFVNALAQHSGHVLSFLDGIRSMNKDDPLNQAILNPATPPDTVLVPIAGRFTVDTVEGGRIRKIGAVALHGVLSVILQSLRHDWVVTEERQSAVEPCQASPTMRVIKVKSRHTSFFGNNLDNDELLRALTGGP
ncbi:hypothetical protein FM042_06815 [Aliidiomarina halalkaliphila]|uniref:DUF7379 domain-containing protein n=1 Tax=Aliidiomarina halalkaliphila TaxID=2593535 RepID=A0A552X0W4_9GAMM|nr:hypothetical protein [Aliidiomarina halalkaliphila]TRW48692.1 hypothetical protein FM042_06815 [Aliidiomarina halalkaliphila]